MTALERARRFIQHDAVRTALVIVPLAMSGAANAGLVFNTVTGTTVETFASTGLTPLLNPEAASSTFSALPNDGVKWWGQTNKFTFGSESGGGAVGCEHNKPDEDAFVEKCQIQLVIGGTGSGSLGQAILAHWDFNLLPTFTDAGANGPDGSVSSVVYDVDFLINGEFAGGGNSPEGNISLSGWTGNELVSWQVILTASFDAFGIGTVQVVVPSNSVDIMPQISTSVPEPGSLLLSAVAFTGLAALRRRRRT